MSTVGQKEQATQNRLVQLFQNHLNYEYLGNWEKRKNNHFAIAEEVSIKGVNDKRPDIVLYVNGIALGVWNSNAPRCLWVKAFGRIWITRKNNSYGISTLPSNW